MLELVVSVCLVAEPDRCKDVSLVFDADSVTPMQCMMGGQVEAAKWIDEHPKWQLKRWACQQAGRFANL